MDAAKWSQGGFHQEIGLVKPMEGMVTNSSSGGGGGGCTSSSSSRGMLERKTRPPEQLNCPRCNSTNTKFCYYNNYSLTQPRYFCKTCRRYWTEGGSLRNVPVGGGSRKNKTSSSSSSTRLPSSHSSISTISTPSHYSNSSPSKPLADLNPPTTTSFSHLLSSTPSQYHQNHPKPPHKAAGQDLNLMAFPSAAAAFQHPPPHQHQQQNYSSSSSALELLKTGMASSGISLNSFNINPSASAAADSATLYSSSTGFVLQDYKPSLGFSIDGNHRGGGGGGGAIHGVQDNNVGRLFFPFGDQMKSISSANQADHHHHHQTKGQANSNNNNHNSAEYWNSNNNGVLGGGSW